MEQLLVLNRRVQEETLDAQQRTLLERQISFLDRHIDTLVYDLYGLTEEERKLVEP